VSRIEDRKTGLYNKYLVTRHDGKSLPGAKHSSCEYFVLDLTHDEHAPAALLAYSYACEREFPHLAIDLRKKVTEIDRKKWLAEDESK